MAVIGLQHFNLRVPAAELQALQDFYVEVLGLRLGARPDFQSRGAWLYAGDRPVLHLTAMNTGEAVPPGAPDRLPEALHERPSALDHIALACDGLELTRARLERRHVEYRMTEVPATEEVQIFVRDPSGIGIELIFPRRALR